MKISIYIFFRFINNLRKIKIFLLIIRKKFNGDWGLGIGDWGPIPNPQSPIPNPQSPISKKILIFLNIFINLKNI